MHVNYLIKKMDKLAGIVEFPQNDNGFEVFQLDLKRVLEENCGSQVAKSLVYCKYTQTFMVKVRVGHEVALPLTGKGGKAQKCNFIFECVRTIDPASSIGLQISTINDIADRAKQRLRSAAVAAQDDGTPDTQDKGRKWL